MRTATFTFMIFEQIAIAPHCDLLFKIFYTKNKFLHILRLFPIAPPGQNGVEKPFSAKKWSLKKIVNTRFLNFVWVEKWSRKLEFSQK